MVLRSFLNPILRGVGHALPPTPIMQSVYQRLVKAGNLTPDQGTVRARNGVVFPVFAERRVNFGDNPDFFLYYFGTWDHRTSRAITDLLSPGDICIDAGANIGWYTMLMAQAVGPRGHVHAFDPDQRAGARLTDTVALNGWQDRITVNQTALGDAPGTATLHVTYTAIYSSIYVQPHSPDRTTIDVPIETLSDYADRCGIDRVALIKMDIEGAEFPALRGAERLFRSQDSPPAIVLEVNRGSAQNAGYAVEDMIAWLRESFGYDLYAPDWRGRLHPATLDPNRPVMDVVAVTRQSRTDTHRDQQRSL